MPTFEQLLHLRLGKLSTAVADWIAMVNKLKALQQDAEAMAKKAEQAEWRGQNANITKPFVLKTAKEFQDAVTQATSIRNILRDLQRDLTAGQKGLRELVEEAPSLDLHIDGKGKVQAINRSPNGVALDRIYESALMIPPQQQRNLDAMAHRIEKILEDVAESDRIASSALRTLTRDGHNFSNVRYRSLDDADKEQGIAAAKKALKLAEKGTDLTAEELSRLNKLLDQYSGNPYFAEKFATGLGPQQTLTFWADMADPPGFSADRQRGELVAALQDNLSIVLGEASRSGSPAMEKWLNEVIELGDARLGIDSAGNPYGFQVMSSLMREGKFDSDFLSSYGDALIAFERTQRDETGRGPQQIWEWPVSRTYLNYGDEGDWGTDPMIGLMEALAHQPAASTDFLGPDHELARNDDGEPLSAFDYLTQEREWPEGRGGSGNRGYESLGHALLTASLGYSYDDPDPQLPEASTRDDRAAITEKVVQLYGENPDLIDEQRGIRDSLTRIGIGHINDFNYSMYNAGGSAEVIGRDELFDSIGSSSQSLHDYREFESMRFLKALAVDESAHQQLSAAQQIYTVSGLSAHQVDSTDAVNFAENSAKIHGLLDKAREQQIITEYDEQDEERNAELEKGGEWRKYVASATLAGAAGSAAALMGPGAGIAAATLVPLAVEIGSGAAQTQYATTVMDQLRAEEHNSEKLQIRSVEDAHKQGRSNMMAPVIKYLKEIDDDELDKGWVVSRMEGGYTVGRDLADTGS